MHARVRLACMVLVVVMAGCSSPSGNTPAPDCPINMGTCSRIIGDTGITLDILPRPVRSMRELDVYVRLDIQPGAPRPERVMLELSMPGMYMGENKVVLIESGKGLYTGKAVIPRCPNGGKLWSAKVEAGSISTAFLFEVE